MENNESSPEEIPILSILQQIKDGTKNPRDLDKDVRQRCVEMMFLEGYSEAQIAQVLDRSEKTIRRDLAEIRKKNAVTPSVEKAKEIVGEMQQQVRAQISRLTRFAVARENPSVARITAEAVAWRIRKEFTEKLQSLGYLPLKPTEFVLTHQSEEKSFAEIEQTLADIHSVAQENGTLNPELEGVIQNLQADLEKAKLSHKVTDLLERQNQSANLEGLKDE